MAQYIQPEKPELKGKEAYLEAGADYVISSIDELKELIGMINSRIVFRERSENYGLLNPYYGNTAKRSG